jgi:hypothetical protein
LEVLAAALGCLVGILGFVPFFAMTGIIRKRFAEVGLAAFKLVLLIPLISFIPMGAAIALCWWIAASYLPIFAAACVIVFLLATIVYTALQARRLGFSRNNEEQGRE